MRVLSIGEDPATVDYSKTPPGIDEAYIRAGLDKQAADMKARGWDAGLCLVPPGVDQAVAEVRRRLAEHPVDGGLLGGGLRMPPERLEVFEALVNEVRRSAPDAALAFDNDPHEGADAVARQAPR